MLLGKKTQNPEQNWFVVLNSFENEIDRKKISQKISEIFSLSLEESLDLVSNTPIILLDNLNKAVALQLRDYFKVLGANLTLSNDVLFKRKCYRTVWPQQPNLGFLHQWKPPLEQRDRLSQNLQEALDPEEALHEIRSLSQEDGNHHPSTFSQIWPSEENLKNTTEEIFSVKKENREIPTSIPKNLKSGPETQEFRELLATHEEKYQILKGEYRQSQEIWEEKLRVTRQENAGLQKKIEEITAQYHALQKERQKLFHDLQERQNIQSKLSEEKEIYASQFRQRMLDLEAELKLAKLQLEDAQKNLEVDRSSKGQLESRSREYLSQMNYYKDKAELLENRLRETEKKSLEDRDRREQLEQRLMANEIDREVQLRQQDAMMAEWKQKLPVEDLVQKMNALQRTLETHEKLMETILKKLGEKDSRFEVIEQELKSYKTSHSQMTQEGLKQISSRLEDKRGFLKRLVLEQEAIEKEIRQQEQALKKVLTDQESIEREILEVKNLHSRFDNS